MSTTRWKGGAAAVAQVNTITPANVLVGNTFTVTMNSKTVTFTATVATVANVCAGLQALLAASTYPEFAEVTWTTDNSTVTGTAKVAGTPFTQTSSASGGTATLVTAAATANGGPYNWDVAANWSGGSVPITGDTVFVENSAVHIRYGLSQSGVTLAALNVAASFTGDIGLPELNQTGSSTYPEYRTQYLTISATLVNVGDGAGQGSPRIKLNTGTNATTLNVRNTGTSSETSLEAFIWKGVHASNVVNVTKGSVGIAVYGGDTATVATLNVGFTSSPSSDASVRAGAGLTLTTLKLLAGTVDLSAGLTTVSQTSGLLTLRAGDVTTWTIDGGSGVYLGTGTISTLNVGAAAFDVSQDMRSRTVSACNLYAGASLIDPHGTLGSGFAFALVRCALPNVSVVNGVGKTYTLS